MTKSNLYIDFHILQTVPPSCVNRDDTGSPKSAVYGGVSRARVSSQAWKRAIRTMFMDIFEREAVGVRTKKLITLLADIIIEKKNISKEEAEKLAKKAFETAGIKFNKKNDAEALLFISHKQVDALADLIIEGKESKEDKKLYTDALKMFPAIDICMFGRMLATDPSLNFDAAVQVAHSISTHAVQNEYDYFTAVDDMSEEDNAGAGHLGTIEFNSATLYRYATINVSELNKNLKEDTGRAIQGFAKAFIQSMPTGKQNTFANRTLPDLIYVTVRTDQPVNLCGAFERPIPATADGYVSKSIDELTKYAKKVYGDFTAEPSKAFIVGKKEDSFAESVSIDQLIEQLGKLPSD